MTEEIELTPTEPPPTGVNEDDIYAKYGKLREKYDLLVKQTATVLGVLDKLKSGELKIEDIELKAAQE